MSDKKSVFRCDISCEPHTEDDDFKEVYVVAYNFFDAVRGVEVNYPTWVLNSIYRDSKDVVLSPKILHELLEKEKEE